MSLLTELNIDLSLDMGLINKAIEWKYIIHLSVYREKQRHLEQIREKLAAQLKQKMDDEDERIKDAVREAEEKREREEAEKDGKMKKIIQSQAEHRHLQVIYNLFLRVQLEGFC